jgi:MFS family permease
MNWFNISFRMLVFGWISDKIGRKTGMMTATGMSRYALSTWIGLTDLSSGIVALFSLLSAASKGANGSVKGTLAALSAFRYVLPFFFWHPISHNGYYLVSFWGSVWVQSTLADLSPPPSNPRTKVSQRMPNTGGSCLLPVRIDFHSL